ncbi:hypothetical protein IQ07DRAFT_340106 [Pyrenochaeta sp. DS3sAY3a]|nr:hypothetical protein IQ07DRAFT_340106 [Pyrenochaeta sp. DS3sAY3a]
MMHLLEGPNVAFANSLANPQVLSCPNEREEAYHAYTLPSDASRTPPNHSLSNFDTGVCFDYATGSLTMVSDLVPEARSCFDWTLRAADNLAPNTTPTVKTVDQRYPNAAPFAPLDQIPSELPIYPLMRSACLLPTSDYSCAPSLCSESSDTTSPSCILKFQPLSPLSRHNKGRKSKSELRKQGRPRLDCRDEPGSLSKPVVKPGKQRRGRTPHGQIERKYRDGLNSELERLRKAVPTLPQSSEGDSFGYRKVKKATVLTAAIDYIKRIENERNALQEENQRIGYARGV